MPTFVSLLCRIPRLVSVILGIERNPWINRQWHLALSLIENLISFAGLVTGFFCCSVVPPSLASAQEQPPPLARHAQPKKKKIMENYQSSPNVYICAPSMPIEPPLHMSSPLPPAHPTPSSEEAWEDNKRYPWMASPSSNCIVSSSGGSLASAHKQQAMCRWCQSLNPGDDCRDGFCSSVWNKENLMRPIHIWLHSSRIVRW